MADTPVYNLLQAIDPSKIRVPISERFSKLTLSSNKKKQTGPVGAKEEEQVREKRDSASRNLLKELSQQQSNNSASSALHHFNPLLRSDSSKDTSDQREKSHLGEYYETTMDSLNVTEDESEFSTEMEQLDVDSLSQKVSALSVICHPQKSLPDSVSTESQCSKFHDIEQIPVKIFKREIIAISSSSSGPDDRDYEITDDEEEILEEDNKTQSDKQDSEGDEEESEEDEIITISDSSTSAAAEEQTEMCVSTVRSIQEAGERTIREFREQFQLPLPTLSPEKMERVAAFLRDVSMEQRNREVYGYFDAEDSICNHNLPPDETKKQANENKLTTADTESMTPKDDEKEETPEAIRERQRRLEALEEKKGDSEENNEDKARRLAKADTQDNSVLNDLKNLEKTPQNRERRLVSADTVENSTISDVQLDTSMSLQVTPTPRRIVEEAKRTICVETDENTLMTQLSGLHLKSPMAPATPQTIKIRHSNLRTPVRADSPTTELTYFSPRTQKTPKTLSNTKKDVRRLQSAETQDNTIKLNTSPSSFRNNKTPQRLASAETEANSIITDKSPSVTKTLKTPLSSKRNQNDVRRLVSAETEENTLTTDAQASSYRQNQKEIRRLVSAETEDNTLTTDAQPSSFRQHPPYSPKSPRRAERRLVSADTEENTMSDLQLSNSPTSYISRRDNNEQGLALDYTEANTNLNNSLTSEKYHQDVNLSVPSTPIYKTPQKNNLYASNETVNSTITCSSEEQCNESAPEHSITILETDDEGSAKSQPSPKSAQSNENNKLSSSLHDNEHDDTESQSSPMTQIQMSMANINISAKINIKITIPDSTETSEDDDSGTSEQRRNTNSLSEDRQSAETNSHPKQLKPSAINCGQAIAQNSSPRQNDGGKEGEGHHSDNEKIIIDSDNSHVEDDNFVNTAAKLLTEVYGNAWQTPDVIRNLTRNNPSDEAKKVRTTSKVAKRTQKHKVQTNNTSNVTEDTLLGDFSMFRRNIVITNSLDSTRLYTPTSKFTKGSKTSKECLTEPRNIIRKGSEKDPQFGVLQTESRQKTARTPMAKISANQIRSQNEKWRQLAGGDSGSEWNNASDDDDADESPDKSWQDSGSERNDSDFVISPERRKTKGRKKGAGALTKDTEAKSGKGNKYNSRNGSKKQNNSVDEIVYLDLSKQEVEVHHDVSQSPPADHDVAFPSKLAEVLKTCRHEDKPKLSPSGQLKKSKRKLFTPIFGDDLESDLSGVEIEKQENRKILLDAYDDGLLLDNAFCPFDARGKPKKLELFNKQLEAVKVGKPIFQLTPSPKKATTPLRRALQENGTDLTPKSKTKCVVQNKTPATTRKELPTSTNGISMTPAYKYSFLKSLDVTVSNNFCHPDACVYRDSYRTKKEDLSRILYDLYNDKLFNKKLDVPITWNKKLLNTAGRCLNKKKLGVRSSVIELSEKVLTSADRLRCTLIHELCHAATWIFSGEGGHGRTWKEWAYRANATFPELPKIGVCHQYEIEYKYTYKCTLCAAKSHAHSKSKKVENIRCSYCHGAIEIFVNKKDKDGYIRATPIKEATGFAKFVKDNYKCYKRDDLKHADVMKLLSREFAALKLLKTAN